MVYIQTYDDFRDCIKEETEIIIINKLNLQTYVTLLKIHSIDDHAFMDHEESRKEKAVDCLT